MFALLDRLFGKKIVLLHVFNNLQIIITADLLLIITISAFWQLVAFKEISCQNAKQNTYYRR